ncbi:MAG: hypothetical protein LQ346_001655 [Caloplaca aetnensis]|nr:MAG: hypothetical protein LQ346_001655 [Caloplaca aetnensis]
MAEKQRQDAPFQRSRTDESPSSGETLNGHDMDGEQKERGRRQEQEKTSNDEEKGGHEDSPQPVGFFSKELNKVRLQVFGLWARTTLILAVFILTVLSLYWAVLFHVEKNMSSLTVFVVGILLPFPREVKTSDSLV